MANEEPKPEETQEDPKPVFVGKHTLIVTGTPNVVTATTGQSSNVGGNAKKPE